MEKIPTEQQTIKGILENIHCKLEDLLEQARKPSVVKENRLNTLLKRFDNLGSGETLRLNQKQMINPFEPREITQP